ncbi:MAG: helix-turn-helix transcriptional regulator [Alphaproteobacteria bacterium]
MKATYLPTGRSVRVSAPYGRSFRVAATGTPRSADLVVLPRDTYEDMARRAEDAEDVAVLRAAAADPASQDYLPAEAVARMIAGEHPVRVWRGHRGLTARRLAARAGVNVAYLSQIETRKKPGSVKALKALAAALRVELDDLV